MSEEPYRLDFERKIIRHCTPTLAALKPANLFTCRDESAPNIRGNGKQLVDPSEYEQGFSQALRECRKKLAPCGVRIEVLARRTSGVLIYVYRPALLKRSIAQEPVRSYLVKQGYDTSSLSACIERLHRRICGTDVQSQLTGECSFPHEIGLFLGYPYEDVMGFIVRCSQQDKTRAPSTVSPGHYIQDTFMDTSAHLILSQMGSRTFFES